MLKRIDLSRNYQNHKEEYMQAIERVCEETAFSGGKFADKFDEEFAAYMGVKAASGVKQKFNCVKPSVVISRCFHQPFCRFLPQKCKTADRIRTPHPKNYFQ